MPFLTFLLGPIGRYLMIGLAVVALFGYVHHAGYKEGIAELDKYKAEQAVLADAQAKHNAELKVKYDQAKKESDDAHTKALQDITAKYNASVVKLRVQSSSFRLPQAATAAGSPEQTCYDTNRLSSGIAGNLAQVSEELAAIVQRGSVAETELTLAKSWALSIGAGESPH